MQMHINELFTIITYIFKFSVIYVLYISITIINCFFFEDLKLDLVYHIKFLLYILTIVRHFKYLSIRSHNLEFDKYIGLTLFMLNQQQQFWLKNFKIDWLFRRPHSKKIWLICSNRLSNQSKFTIIKIDLLLE